MGLHPRRAAAEERAQELAVAWRAIWRGLSGDVGLWAGRAPPAAGSPKCNVAGKACAAAPGCRPAAAATQWDRLAQALLPQSRLPLHSKPLWTNVGEVPFCGGNDCHLTPAAQHAMTCRLLFVADPNAASDQHWKRDKAEDASRRRRRLRRNFGFRRYEDAPRGGAPVSEPPPADALPSPLPAGKGSAPAIYMIQLARSALHMCILRGLRH